MEPSPEIFILDDSNKLLKGQEPDRPFTEKENLCRVSSRAGKIAPRCCEGGDY
jgi:hypothetical protein